MCVTNIGFHNKLPVSLQMPLDIKPEKHKPTRPVLVIAKEHDHKH